MRTQTECSILTSKISAKLMQYYYFHAEFLEEIRYMKMKLDWGQNLIIIPVLLNLNGKLHSTMHLTHPYKGCVGYLVCVTVVVMFCIIPFH